MQNNCTNTGETMYFVCRKEAARYNEALNSRAGASEYLNVSESSLRNYELGLSPVPVDVVVRMADLYGAPELRAAYCKNDCPIGKYTCSNIADEVKEISTVVCSLLHHAKQDELKEIGSELLRIASDGRISEDETESLVKIVKYLDVIVRDINGLRLLQEKGKNGA